MASRILEVDPWTQEIVWSCGGRPQKDLLSTMAGWVERLGGNTLITESNSGRVLEVTPDRRLVWELVNPNRVGGKSHMVAVVNALDRVPRDLPFLQHQSEAPRARTEDAAPGARSAEASRAAR
jgi:hypothetical protein